MRQAASSPLLERPRRSPVVGAAVVVVLVAATTALIYPLKHVAPLGATGIVYLLAVLAVPSWYGLWLGLVAALASAAAFNWFHIPPTGQFTVAKGEDWVALGVLLAVAIVAKSRSGCARARTPPTCAGARPTLPRTWRAAC
jgi:two-component system sensor histidine kinase KdpD